MAIDYYRDLLNKTRYIDSRIKDTVFFDLCCEQYINQKYNNCQCIVEVPSIVKFKSRNLANAGLGIRYESLSKKVIQMNGNYCLTYSEVRQFNSKHNIVNLDIEIEFLFGEKIKISASKKNYGVILKVNHYKVSEIDNSYVPYAHIPTTAIEDFHLIPYGEIFLGCYPQTVQMFEDYYSGDLYSRKVLKK